MTVVPRRWKSLAPTGILSKEPLDLVDRAMVAATEAVVAATEVVAAMEAVVAEETMEVAAEAMVVVAMEVAAAEAVDALSVVRVATWLGTAPRVAAAEVAEDMVAAEAVVAATPVVNLVISPGNAPTVALVNPVYLTAGSILYAVISAILGYPVWTLFHALCFHNRFYVCSSY